MDLSCFSNPAVRSAAQSLNDKDLQALDELTASDIDKMSDAILALEEYDVPVSDLVAVLASISDRYDWSKLRILISHLQKPTFWEILINCKVFGIHEYTCRANLGIPPTDAELMGGISGFNVYAQSFCSNCGKLLR